MDFLTQDTDKWLVLVDEVVRLRTKIRPITCHEGIVQE